MISSHAMKTLELAIYRSATQQLASHAAQRTEQIATPANEVIPPLTGNIELGTLMLTSVHAAEPARRLNAGSK